MYQRDVMTEDQVERLVERRMDALDRRFLAGQLTQAEYDAEVRQLDAWARTAQRR